MAKTHRTPEEMAKHMAYMSERAKATASPDGTRPLQSRHMRLRILKALNMSPEALEASKPTNCFDFVAKNLVLVSDTRDAKGQRTALAVQAWKEIKETLGERIGSRWKDTVEERERKNASTIIVDIPQPVPTPYEN